MPQIDPIQLRAGTAAAWTSANPVLMSAEPGLETDTKKVKYGDGVTVWTSLPYSGGAATFADLTGSPYDNTALSAVLRNTRTATGAGASLQADDNALIFFDSATPFNFTLDQLTATTKISFVNIGIGAVTFINGAGVSLTGNATLPGAVGTDYPCCFVFYQSLTTPQVVNGGQTVSFKGLYASSAALISAYPSASTGDYAYVDAGVSSDVQIWLWDASDTTWKQGGSASIVGWSTTTAGTVERSTTAEAQNIVTRALAGSSNSSNDDGRTPSEKGLVETLLSFIAAAWTWTSQQTFAIGPIISDGTASVPVMFNASKKLVANAFAALADFVTGTDNVKQVTVAGLLSFRRLKRQSCSISGGTMTIDLASSQESKWENTTPVTADFTIAAFSNASNMEFVMITIYATGAFYITLQTNCVMETIDDRWNNTLKKLYISAGTASPITISFNKMNSLYDVRAGFAQYSS